MQRATFFDNSNLNDKFSSQESVELLEQKEPEPNSYVGTPYCSGNESNDIKNTITDMNGKPFDLSDAYADYGITIFKSIILGKGGSANVFSGTFKGHLVAVKEYHDATVWSKNEMEVIQSLNHPYIIKSFTYSFQPPFLVTELMRNGSLSDTLNKKNLTWDVRLKIVLQIASALQYLHDEMNIVHRDIKGANILLDASYNAKLADFDRSSIEKLTFLTGTRAWEAPEIIAAINCYITANAITFNPTIGVTGSEQTKRSDIYSFGVTLIELMFPGKYFINKYLEPLLKLNYPGVDFIEQRTRILEDLINELKQQYPLQFVELAESCIKVNPDERPTAKELLQRLESLLQTNYIKLNLFGKSQKNVEDKSDFILHSSCSNSNTQKRMITF